MLMLVVLAAASFVFFLLGEPSWEDFGWATFLIVMFTPMKGITYRRLGGRRPYQAALLSTASWQAIGLPIDLDRFWVIIGASFIVAFIVDFIALLANATGPNPVRNLFLGAYGSIMTHALMIGFFWFQRNALAGAVVLFVGVGLFMLPAFYADRFAPHAG